MERVPQVPTSTMYLWFLCASLKSQLPFLFGFRKNYTHINTCYGGGRRAGWLTYMFRTNYVCDGITMICEFIGDVFVVIATIKYYMCIYECACAHVDCRQRHVMGHCSKYCLGLPPTLARSYVYSLIESNDN